MLFLHINMKQLYLPKGLQDPLGLRLMWHSIVHTTARKCKIVGMKRTARAGHLISAFLKKKKAEYRNCLKGAGKDTDARPGSQRGTDDVEVQHIKRADT